MLDLGVGGGRTTLHFAPRVQSYLGVDYAPAMVAACQARFSDHPAWRMEVADARRMFRYPDHSFDFVLFSFNGIDYLETEEDRRSALQEIRRVLTPGGVFAFSTHNLRALRTLGRIRWTFSPHKLLRRIVRFLRLRIRHGDPRTLLRQDRVWIDDGTFEGRLCTSYSKPEIVLAELEQTFFPPPLLFGLDGTPRFPPFERVEDPWLYYLCDGQAER